MFTQADGLFPARVFTVQFEPLFNMSGRYTVAPGQGTAGREDGNGLLVFWRREAGGGQENAPSIVTLINMEKVLL